VCAAGPAGAVDYFGFTLGMSETEARKQRALDMNFKRMKKVYISSQAATVPITSLFVIAAYLPSAKLLMEASRHSLGL
jgi:hypothetical protein